MHTCAELTAQHAESVIMGAHKSDCTFCIHTCANDFVSNSSSTRKKTTHHNGSAFVRSSISVECST